MKRETRKRTNHVKIVVAVLLALLLPVTFLQTNQAMASGDYTYEVADGLATITGYVGAGGDVVVPATLDGYPVVAIGDNAFGYNRTLTGVTLPENLTTIGKSAFQSCQYLASVTLPAGLVTIDDSAFQFCHSLAGVTLPESLVTIGNSAFNNCVSLASLVLPDGLATIGMKAFENCRLLTVITIPGSVTNIGFGAFHRCSALTAIHVDIDNAMYKSRDGVLFDSEGTKLIQYPIGRTDTSFTFPSGVSAIGDYAFYDCSYLADLTIPNGVTAIGANAFYYSKLVSVILPGSITSMGDSAFTNCSYLTSVMLLDGITSLGNQTFEGCSSLTEITIPDSITSLGDALFYSCTSLTSINLPEGLTEIGNYAFNNCSSLTGITIPASVTNIEWNAFANCAALTNLTFLGITPPTTADEWIGNTPLYLRGHAYYGSSFPAPNGVFSGLKMGDYIPEDYYYTITDGQATITSYHGIGGDVTIPATLGGCPVIGIGDNAFTGCDALTSLTVPDSVTSIGTSPFGDCWDMSDITFLGLTPPETATDWITTANYDLRGHAYYGASFPSPGSSLNGLTMGDYIPENYYYDILDGQATITRYIGKIENEDVVTPATLGSCPVVAIGNGWSSVYGPLVNSVEIQDGVTSINNHTFAGNDSLTQ